MKKKYNNKREKRKSLMKIVTASSSLGVSAHVERTVFLHSSHKSNINFVFTPTDQIPHF